MKPFAFLLVLAFCPILFPAAVAAADLPSESALRPVGVAAVDITPDYPVRLGGYGGRREYHEGVEQPLFAKALAIGSDDDGPAVLVTVDNVGVPGTMRAELLDRLGRKANVRDECFAIASSHTHCGPMLEGLVPNLFSMDIPAEHAQSVAALAPRGFFSNSPVRDGNFDIHGVRKAFAKAAEVYALLDATDRLTLVTPDAGHDFPEAERLAAYAWLDRMLK